MIISEKIFKIMEERGMSQIEFSKATGISQSTISDWKRKKTNPASDKIMTICDVLNVTPYELLQGKKQGKAGDSDYLVASKGTSGYEILTEIEDLDDRQLERLKGYISALKE